MQIALLLHVHVLLFCITLWLFFSHLLFDRWSCMAAIAEHKVTVLLVFSCDPCEGWSLLLLSHKGPASLSFRSHCFGKFTIAIPVPNETGPKRQTDTQNANSTFKGLHSSSKLTDSFLVKGCLWCLHVCLPPLCGPSFGLAVSWTDRMSPQVLHVFETRCTAGIGPPVTRN